MNSFAVELRIEGIGLNPEEATRSLGVAPVRVQIGDPHGMRMSQRKGLWSYNGAASGLCQEWKTLEEGLRAIIRDLNSVKDILDQYAKSYDVYWWCGFFQQSFDGSIAMNPELLRQLHEFGFELVINTYCSSSMD